MTIFTLHSLRLLVGLQWGIFIVFLAALYCFVTGGHWNVKTRKLLKDIPGPPWLPVVGNALQLINHEDFFNKVQKWSMQYGDRIRLFVGSLTAVILLNPDDIEKVLSSQILLQKSNAYAFLESSVGQGLLTSSGQKWYTRRKILSPAFHSKVIKGFHRVFNEQSQILVSALKERLEKGNVIEMHSMFSRCALDIICETVMGKALNSQTDLSHPYVIALDKYLAIICKRLTSPWLHPNLLFRLSPSGRSEQKYRAVLHKFVHEVIKERKAEGVELSPDLLDDSTSQGSTRKFAFLELLIRLQMSGETDLDDKGILEETYTFMVAGYDTTAAALTFTLYLLGMNPKEQEKVHAELDEVLDSDRDSHIEAKDLPKLKYLDCCIKEGSRLYPSIPFYGRRLEQDFQLDAKVTLPAGAEIMIIPWVTHRLASFFPKPEEFQPSRHFPEVASKRHSYAYIPFAAGPRMCIGHKYALAEQKIVLAHVLRHFRVRVDQPERVVFLPEIILRPKNGVHFLLEPR